MKTTTKNKTHNGTTLNPDFFDLNLDDHTFDVTKDIPLTPDDITLKGNTLFIDIHPDDVFGTMIMMPFGDVLFKVDIHPDDLTDTIILDLSDDHKDKINDWLN